MSWTIFYYEMQTHMMKQTISQASPVPAGSGLKGKAKAFVKGKVMDSIVDAQSFAEAFCNAYDKTVKTGKSIIGGVPVGNGNKKIMQAVLISEMLIAKASGKGMFSTLLDLCGTAVIAYWTGAEMAKFPLPNIPCILPPAAQNITTLKAYNLSPGKWTSIIVGPQTAFEPFLLSFIASAMLHCLTLGGFFQCQCALPPPAPPAPSILPWAGYYVAPPTPAGGLLKKALLKTLATRRADLKNLKNILNTIKDKAIANQKLIVGLVAGTTAAGIVGYNMLNSADEKQLQAYLQTPQGMAELTKLQKEGISSQLADEISAAAAIGNSPIYDDVKTTYDDAKLTDTPKTISQQIKDGDIKNKVNKITNMTKKDVINNNTLQKSVAQSFKTPSSGDVSSIIPKSIPAPAALIVKESYGIAYNKIQAATISNLQKIDLLEKVSKNLAVGLPTENIDKLIREKENNKTKG